MKKSFKTGFLLATMLALLSAGLTTTAFAGDYDFRPSYYLCVRDSGGVIETMLKCVREEQKYQDKRLKSNFQAYLKTKSPDDQTDQNLFEDLWKDKRETFCSSPEGPDHTAMLQREMCFLDMTAYRAGGHRMMLEADQKKRSEGKHSF